MKTHRILTLACCTGVVLATFALAGKPDRLRRTPPGIFVPPPRGSGETLDGAEAGGFGEAGPEVVTTIRGDKLHGKVVALPADGDLKLVGPQFSGDVLVARSVIDAVRLKATLGESGRDEVVLTNGDRILGEVVSITAGKIVVKTDVAGPLTIPAVMVTSLSFDRGATTLVTGGFSTEGKGRRRTEGSGWTVSGGKLVLRTSGSGHSVYAMLEQNEPVTMVARVKAATSSFHCYMSVFADGPAGRAGRESVFLMFRTSSVTWGYVRGGGTNHNQSASLGRNFTEGTLRFSYDPKTGKGRAWLDDKDLGEHAMGYNRKKGACVLFTSYYPCEISDLRVLKGVVPPGGEVLGAEDVHKVEFVNGDKLSVESITMEPDGTIVFKTAHGELKSSADKIAVIGFATGERAKPRRRKGDVTVRLRGGALTCRLVELDSKHLVGESECYGELKLLRAGVSSIDFNIYGQGGPK